MKISIFPYSAFVIPFLVGVLLLLAICTYKYIHWISQFDEAQRTIIRHNWFSWKTIPALWEMFREGLVHFRILRKNIVLGIMHQSFALGWALLIVVGAIQSNRTIACFNHEQSIEQLNTLIEQDGWYSFDKDRRYLLTKRVTYDEAGHKIHLKYHRPFYAAIFYNYFIHKEPAMFKHSKQYADLMDGILLYIFLGLTLAFAKRIWSKSVGMRRTTSHNLFDRLAKLSLWLIFPLRLLSESITASMYQNGGFLTNAIGSLFNPDISGHLEWASWLCYSLALLVFFFSMPFTRYMHIFTELLLIWFRKIGVKESEQPTGYTKFELNACSRCGVCIQGCPLDKDLNNHRIQPVYLIRGLRNHNRPAKMSIIADNCLMCERCVEDCPVGIDISAIRRMTRNKGKLDSSGNYSYLTTPKPFNAIGRVVFFGGCMSHLTPGIPEAMMRIFEAAGQKYWYMDRDRSICCGRPLRQQGFRNQADDLKKKNTEMIINSGATMLVTSCPICYRSFKDEYDLGIPVMHHTEYIDILIRKGRISVGRDSRRVSYHDPCELGRGCGIYDQPRSVLNAVTTLQKTRNQREKSICCGFNMGNTVLSIEEQTTIRNDALRNLTERPVDAIATACPMCKKAFLHSTNEYPVQDIAEIVAANLIK
ncbi:MAG: 4Fe-4S dicluster domain-containing protein [Bacteroidaceae bacterium]|nr:4Fe-4S dicluster domain-containing protein [Bacteroidaceae bacterium]